MKSNYQPWQINIDDFYKITDEQEKLKFLLNFAVLAPSSHNSQPWEFIISNKEINILINKERSLEKGDPSHRLLMMSFGCLIKNILTASDYFGLKAVVNYFPDNNNLNVVQIIFEKSNEIRKEDKNHLIFQIPKRHTNRMAYLSKDLPLSFLSSIERLSNEKFKASIISNENSKNNIVKLIIESTIEMMDRNDFREELSQYIKSNFTKSKTGMPGFTIGLPAPVSIFASLLIKKINLSKKGRKRDEKLLKQETPAFLIISTNKDEKEDWLNAGIFLQNVWLLAQFYGLSCSPFASVTQMPSFREKLQNILHSTDFPQLVLRIGYPKKNVKPSPRFMVEDLIKNIYN